QMLSTISGAIITVASLVLSMTLVALTLLSQQLGPRILQIFMEDARTKLTLGYFLATFIFSMLTLGATGTGKEGEFVPLLTTYTAGFLALLAFAVVVHFVQHIATSIQADVIVTRLGDELNTAIESEIKRGEGHTKWLDDEDALEPSSDFDSGLHYFTLDRSGYIESLDESSLLSTAVKHETQITMLCRPGHYVLAGVPVAAVERGSIDLSKLEGIEREIKHSVTVGARRSRRLHIDFEIHALVEVALRALSPGVNDPFTALTCIDRLTDAIARLLDHGGASRLLLDDDGDCRVALYPTPVQHYLDAAFFPVRQAATGNVTVILKILSALRQLCLRARSLRQLDEILAHGEMVEKAGRAAALIDHDLNKIADRAQSLKKLASYCKEHVLTVQPADTRADAADDPLPRVQNTRA
ncbi:MAG: DUF2254 domain-containing protein, partial [Thermomicrobiales bacterium]